MTEKLLLKPLSVIPRGTGGAQGHDAAQTEDVHLLTPDQVAQRLAVSRRTVYALVGSGELASVRVGRLRRVSIGQLRAYIERMSDGEDSR